MLVMAEWIPPPPTGIAASEEAVAAFVVLSRPEGLTARWEGPEPEPALRTIIAEEASALSSRVPPGRHQEVGCAFLRLTVRPVAPDSVVTSTSSYSIGFEAGPGGAPPDYPRVPAQVLLEHAATNANRSGG